MVIHPKILLIDLDQTLLRSRSFELRIRFLFYFFSVFRNRGVSVFELIRFLRHLKKSIEQPESNSAHVTNQERASQVAKRYGITEESLLQGITEIFRRLLPLFSPIEEAENLFRDLKPIYRVVLATNPAWPESILNLRLSRGNLRKKEFERVTHAGNMSFTKSNPEYYRQLLGQLACSPDECLMIGDSKRKDGVAAEAGVPVFLLRKNLRKRNPLFIEGDLQDLRSLLIENPKQPLILINPKSQNGRAIKKWNKIKKRFSGSKVVLATPGVDDKKVLNLIQCFSRAGGTQLIAAGGDGTANWVLNLIAQNELSLKLGLISLGSSNDYHKRQRSSTQLKGGIKSRIQFDRVTEEELLEISWIDSETKVQQLRYSALNGSVGLIANGNAIFSRPDSFSHFLKRYSVSLAIALSAIIALLKKEARWLQIGINDGPPQSFLVCSLSFFKSPHFSGDFRYGFWPKPGFFSVAFVKNTSRLQLIKIMIDLLRGRFRPAPYAESINEVRSLNLKSDRAFSVEIDGEVYSTQLLSVRLSERRVLLCP